jgi:ligand-binding sensor domain-containing protein
MPRSIYFLLLSVLYTFTTFESHSQSRSYKNYTTDNGLPSNTVYASFQDSKGFMWFGTPLGVSRYDGYTFSHLTIRNGLSDNEVFNFFEDSSGRIWFRTLNGKVSYFKDGFITNSSTDTTLTLLDSQSYISGMFEDAQGTVWISTLRDGIVNYSRSKQIHRIFSNNDFESINDIFSIGNRRIAIVSRTGIYKVQMNENQEEVLEIDTCHLLTTANLQLPRSVQLSEHDILYSSHGHVYAGNLQDDTFNLFMRPASSILSVYNIGQDHDNIWICTNKGVIPYSKITRKFLIPFLEAYKISSVIRDREGNCWITTLDGGVFFCSGKEIFSYTVADGLVSSKISCLSKDSANALWFGYENGIVGIYHHGCMRSIPIANNVVKEDCRIRKIHFNGGRCWIASLVGLYLLEGSSTTLLCGNVREIIEHPQGKLWLGASDRVFVLSRSIYEAYKNDVTVLPLDCKLGYGNYGILKKERSNAFFLDKQKTMWISTDKHLYKAIDDSLIAINRERFNDKVQVNDFEELSDTTLVLATNGDGVIFFDKHEKYVTVGEEQGLTSGVCNAISADASGALWVATSNGVNKITGYPDKLKIEHYTVLDGMLTNEITDLLVLNDTVWVATNKGLNFFDRHLSIQDTIQPLIYIDHITVHGKRYLPQMESLIFNHYENDVEIKYVSPLYNSIGEVLYRYKLHRDSPWKYTRDPFVYLPELSWDEYEFIVAAKGRSGIWSKEVSLSFTIKKPFWRSNFFILSVIGLLIAMAWGGIAFYLRQQRTKAMWQQRALVSELRTLRAQMNPHFIFNALNSIHALFLRNDMVMAQEYLGRFGKLMRSILDQSEEITIPIHEELASITNYLEIEKLRMNYNFTYSIDVDPALDIYTQEMPSMILQPFIENSIWHGFHHTASDQKLTIQLAMGHECIIITLQDNGIGRKKSFALKKNHRSKGINLIRDRIEIINFERKQKIELSIEDLEDEYGNHPGTLVTFKIPSI